VFDYRQAQEVRDAFEQNQVRYLFIGKSGAVLLGFPDTTQDVDVFVEKTLENGQNLVRALRQLGFDLTEKQSADVQAGRDFVQLKNGPFDLDLIFALDGDRNVCRGLGETGANRWVSRLQFGRHHREQTSFRPKERSRITTSLDRLPGLVA
jgi:hypothetical protein